MGEGFNVMSENAVLKIKMKRICFIDDSKTSAFVTKKMLKQQGYAVDHFPDAESALEALMENDYALIITDLMISADGGVNGDDLIRLVRLSGHPVKSQIPIIVVTGTGDQEILHGLIEVGANKVLQKPLDADSLHESIQLLIHKSTQESAPDNVLENDAPNNVDESDTDGFALASTNASDQSVNADDEIKLNNMKAESESPDFSRIELDLTFDLMNEARADESSKESDAFKTKQQIQIKEEIRNQERDTSARESQIKPPEVSKQEKQEININDDSLSSFSMSAYSSELSIESLSKNVNLHSSLEKTSPSNSEKKPIVKDESLTIPVLTKAVETDVHSIGNEIEALLGEDKTLSVPSFKNTMTNRSPDINPYKESADVSIAQNSQTEERLQLKAEQDTLKHEQELLRIAQQKIRQEQQVLTENLQQHSPHPKTEAHVRQEAPRSTVTNNNASPASTKSHEESIDDNPLLALLDHLDDESSAGNFSEQKNGNKKSSGLFDVFSTDGGGSKLLLILIVLAVIIPAIWFWYMSQKVIEVTTLGVEVGPIYSQISVPGRIDSKRKIKVSARESGQLVKMYVSEGEVVKKGQVLAQIDDSEAVSNIKRTEARLLSIEEEVSLTSKTQERLQRALDLGAVSRQMVEDAEARWKSASAAQSVIEEELKSAELKRDRLKIRGPFSGVVTAVYVQEGQWVAQADNLFSLVDMKQRVVEIAVDASDSASLHVGQTVMLRSGAFDGIEWAESIIKIGSATNSGELSNTIKVTASLSKDSPALRVGQQVDAEIRTNSKQEALLLPYDVVFNHDGLQTVAVIENSTIVFVPIETGIESFTRIEVLKGLRAGQQVVIPSDIELEPGMNAVMIASLDTPLESIIE